MSGPRGDNDRRGYVDRVSSGPKAASGRGAGGMTLLPPPTRVSLGVVYF
jgi:hypothetical protein